MDADNTVRGVGTPVSYLSVQLLKLTFLGVVFFGY